MLFPLLLLVSSVSALNPEIVGELKKGSVFLKVGAAGEASGFFVKEGWILTNRHVVESLGVGGELQVVLDSGTRESVTLVGTVLHYSGREDVDLAIVGVSPQPGRILTIREAPLPFETETVVAVGFPMGSHRTFGDQSTEPPVSLRPGAVTALHHTQDGSLLFIEHNANMQTGNSGGALVDDAGAVVGVNVAMLRQDESTKLAIPSAAVAVYLRDWQTLPVPESVQGRPSNAGKSLRDQLVTPFGREGVKDVAITPNGEAFVLEKGGSLSQLLPNGEWKPVTGGPAHDIALDDMTGQLYAVGKQSGLKRRIDQGWEQVGGLDGIRQLAASDGVLWAVTENGSLFFSEKQEWKRIDTNPVEEVVACGGLAIFRRGTRVWGIKEGEVVQGGRQLASGIRQVSCFRDRAWAIRADGSIVDLLDKKIVDDAEDNVAIFAIPEGLLAVTQTKSLWFFNDRSQSWSRLSKP
jgi:S1-C subfamily serine protease